MTVLRLDREMVLDLYMLSDLGGYEAISEVLDTCDSVDTLEVVPGEIVHKFGQYYVIEEVA